MKKPISLHLFRMNYVEPSPKKGECQILSPFRGGDPNSIFFWRRAFSPSPNRRGFTQKVHPEGQG